MYTLFTTTIRESVDSLCRDGTDTLIKPNKCNGSELLDAAAISPFRHITWLTSVSIHDKTLKGGKAHCYNDIHEIADFFFFFFKQPSTKFVQVFTLIFYQTTSNSLAQCLSLAESL